MGSKSSSTKATTYDTTTNTVNSTLSGQNNYQVANSSGADVTFTDQGAIHEAFGFADTVAQGANKTINSALSSVSANTDKTVSALKEFATQLTVGDYAGTRYIAFAVIAAVVIVAALFVWGNTK